MSGPYPPCQIHTGTNSPSKITVSVTQQGEDWIVSMTPILLENDADVVCWDVAEVVQSFANRGATIQDINIEFFNGPQGYDPHLGPFLQPPPTFDNQSNTLTATGRNHEYGDCYYYNIWVSVKGGGAEFLFPIDPQVDNLMPPPPPSPPPSSKERRPR